MCLIGTLCVSTCVILVMSDSLCVIGTQCVSSCVILVLSDSLCVIGALCVSLCVILVLVTVCESLVHHVSARVSFLC